jgi:hypothetical protein
VVGLGSWAAFGGAWWLVFRRHAQVSPAVLVALGLVAVVVWLVTIGWVARNRRIYRVKGSRNAVPVPAPAQVADRLGRPLVILPGARRTGEVVLRLTADGRKAYEPAEVPR